MHNILFVNPDVKYRKMMEEIIKIHGYQVTAVKGTLEAMKEAKKTEFDLLITDLHMEPVGGFQLIELMRKAKKDIKIIVLTKSVEIADEVRAIELLVDEYLHIPVQSEIFIKRIDKVMFALNNPQVVELKSKVDQIYVDVSSRRVYKKDEYVETTLKEYNLLVFFLQNKNKVFTREQILGEVWRITEDYAYIRTVDTHIKKIRAKLGLTSIYSVRGIGYEWFEEERDLS